MSTELTTTTAAVDETITRTAFRTESGSRWKRETRRSISLIAATPGP